MTFRLDVPGHMLNVTLHVTRVLTFYILPGYIPHQLVTVFNTNSTHALYLLVTEG